jgi:hypothetical protein
LALSTPQTAVGFSYYPRVPGVLNPEGGLALCASLKGQEQGDADQEHDCYD